MNKTVVLIVGSCCAAAPRDGLPVAECVQVEVKILDTGGGGEEEREGEREASCCLRLDGKVAQMQRLQPSASWHIYTDQA